MTSSEHAGRITRNAGVLVALTTVSRVGGLIRETAISHYFGASGRTDEFYMAFTIPHVMGRWPAGGPMGGVVQPAYQAVRSKDRDDAARRFYAAMLGWTL